MSRFVRGDLGWVPFSKWVNQELTGGLAKYL